MKRLEMTYKIITKIINNYRKQTNFEYFLLYMIAGIFSFSPPLIDCSKKNN